jgi:hypothetical protein
MNMDTKKFVRGALFTAAFLGGVVGFISGVLAVFIYAPPVVSAALIFIVLCLLGGLAYSAE